MEKTEIPFTRDIVICEDISRALAHRVIANILFINEQDDEDESMFNEKAFTRQPITMYINS